MNNTLTTMLPAALAAVVLVGCDSQDNTYKIQVEQEENAVAESEAKSATLNQLSKDQEEAKIFLKQMQEKDPSFVDAYYRINPKGNKEMVLVKDLGNGNVAEYPAFEANALPGGGVTGAPNQTQHVATDGGTSSVMPALLGGMLAGAVMGHLASNSMQSTIRPKAQQEEEKRRATSSYGSAVAANNQNWARQQASQRAATRVSAAKAGTSAGSTSSSPTAKSGAFGGGGARAGGYGGGTSAGSASGG